mgnify:CR=1 FL=1|tara:strand:+ start:162 stop:524 length:363 start_codon:yes stop_codon:yes gene_type:complete
MDGAIDLRLIITLLGVAASVFGGVAAAKFQIRQQGEDLKELQKLVRSLDGRFDKLHTLTETQEQRIDILAKMSSPDRLEARHRETSKLLADVANALERIKHLETMHNTKHPIVASERKAT